LRWQRQLAILGLAYFAFFFGTSLVSRLLLAEQFPASLPSSVMGWLSVSLMSVWLTVLSLCLRAFLGRLAASLLLLCFCAYAIINIEILYTQDRVLALDELAAGLSWIFIRNSLQHMIFPGFALASLVMAAVVCALPLRDQGREISRSLLLAAGLGGVLLVLLPVGDWRDSHVLAATMAQFWRAQQGGVDEAHTMPMEPVPGLETPVGRFDSLLTAKPGARPNVVLLVLEGVSGAYLKQAAGYSGIGAGLAMPELDRVAARGLVAPNFLTHGHQTIRGLYAMLCADYNKLGYGAFKSEEYVALPEVTRPPCLPQLMRERGYQTAFLQAADLRYMGKDRFMPAVGFDRVEGEESLNYSYAESDWGPDDKAFLEQAAVRIEELHAGRQPFFLTLLTVGTHHPFVLPHSTMGKEKDKRRAAFRYLDAALGQFVDRLQSQGVLEDTLLIITSDETRGVAGNLLSRNWGLLLLLGPGIPAKLNPAIHGLVDIPATVLDFTAQDEHTVLPMAGYSLLRNYSQPRELLYSSLENMYWLRQDKVVHHCSSASSCSRWQAPGGNPFVKPGSSATMSADSSAELYKQLNSLRSRANGRLRYAADAIEIPMMTVEKFPGRKLSLLEGRYLQLNAGSHVQVELQIAYRGKGSVAFAHSFVDVSDDSPLTQELRLPQLSNAELLTLRYQFTTDAEIEFAHPSFSVQSPSARGFLELRQLRIRQLGPGSSVGPLFMQVTSLEAIAAGNH
jgi:arylsulfatase A-like enzyme